MDEDSIMERKTAGLGKRNVFRNPEGVSDGEERGGHSIRRDRRRLKKAREPTVESLVLTRNLEDENISGE